MNDFYCCNLIAVLYFIAMSASQGTSARFFFGNSHSMDVVGARAFI